MKRTSAKGPQLRDKLKNSKPPANKSGPVLGDKAKAVRKNSLKQQGTATDVSEKELIERNYSGEDEGTDGDFLGTRSLSMDEFMRASNMVETNLEKLSATLERSLNVSTDNLVSKMASSHPRERSSSAPRLRTEEENDLTRKVSLATMEHVYALRVRAEAENEEKSKQCALDELELTLVEEECESPPAETPPHPPRNPKRFESASNTDVRSNAEKFEEAQLQIQQLQYELDATNVKLKEANEKVVTTENQNRSLENAVKELEEALSSSSSNIQEKYNVQKAELQSAHELIKETLQQVWDLKRAQIDAQKAAKLRPRIDL